MNWRALSLVISLNLNPFTSATPQSAVAMNNTGQFGTITGTVFKSDSITVIPKTRIQIRDSNFAWLKQVYTDENGSYILDNLEPGLYILEADGYVLNEGVPYLPEHYHNERFRLDATLLLVTADDTLKSINFALEEPGYITGTVYGKDSGYPLPDINVYIEEYLNIPGRFGISDHESTDSKGNYRSTRLFSGEYYIRIGPGHGYEEKWHIDSPDKDHATLVSVTAPSIVTDMNATLGPEAGQIAGFLYKSDGVTPIRDLTVIAYSTDPLNPHSNTAYSDSLGLYIIRMLQTGDYRVWTNGWLKDNTERICFTEYFNNVTDEEDATSVPVVFKETTRGVDFQLLTFDEFDEIITKPGTPIGLEKVFLGNNYRYGVPGSNSNQYHPLEYRFHWGDGTFSEWSPSAMQVHGWSTTGIKYVYVDVRCKRDTLVCNTSDSLMVTVFVYDTTKPYLSDCYPPPGSVGIPQNTDIQLKLNDSESELNINFFRVEINGIPIVYPNNDNQTYTSEGAHISLTDQQYSLYYEPSPGFKTDETVTVRVRGVDNKQLGPLNFMDSTYTFQIGATEVVTIKSDTIDGTGGTIACPTNGVVMMVPPGGLNGPTIITIDTLSASGVPALPDSVEYGRTAFHFGPDGLVFNDTITIKIPYTESDLEQVQATDPFDLNLYYYSTRTGEWIKLNKARADSMYVFQRVKEFCYLVLCNEERIQTGSDQTIKTKPIQYSLIQNFPNPFNPSTTIRYSIQAPGQVRLVIYNTNGQIMDVPVVAYQQAGHYQISYENRDLPSGIYYYQIKTNGFVYTRKMVKIQ